MIQPTSWIEGTFAEQALTATAALVLPQRLNLVAELAGQIAAKPRDIEPELVHKIRVASRRATAALRVFSDTVPRRRAKRLRRELRKVRRAANMARNLDVLQQRYAAPPASPASANLPPATDKDVSRLNRTLKRRRRQAEKPLRKIARRLARGGYAGRVEALCERIRWRGECEPATLLAAAGRQLRPLVGDLVSFEPLHATGESLHQLRICGKRLRYSLEIFAGAIPDLCARVYPIVVEMQDRLGQANDHGTAAELFKKWRRGKHARPFAALRAAEKQAQEACQTQCAAWLEGDDFRDLCDALETFSASAEFATPPKPYPATSPASD